jgi:hypothetical protein
MAAQQAVFGDVLMQGDLTLLGTLTPGLSRSSLNQATERLKLNPVDWRIWDAVQTNLGATATSDDDLSISGGTFASASVVIATGDVKAVSKTRYARIFVPLPACYVTGSTCTIRAYSGMKTTVADTSATVDFECYRSNDAGGIGSDLCTTSAQSINSLSASNKDFVITPASLLPGDMLDIRMTIATVDSATGTAVIAQATVELLLGMKG